MRLLPLLLSLPLLLAGCGSDQDVDPGTLPRSNQGAGGAAGSGASQAGQAGAGGAAAGAGGVSGGSGQAGSGGSGGSGQAGEAGAAGMGTGVVVKVEYGGSVVPVDMGALPVGEYKGLTLARMSDVWAASGHQAELSKVRLDFEGDDGFHPSSKPSCQVALTGATLEQGYIDPVLRNLFWDDALGLSGCYKVKGLARLIVSDQP